MIMCDFCALSPVQRKDLLKKFYTLLKPGGFVLLDVYSLNSFKKKDEITVYEKNQLNGFWSDKEYYGFLNTFKYQKEKVTPDKYTIVEESRTFIIYNWLQYFTKDSLKKEFEECGFKVNKYFDDVAGSTFSSDTDEFAIVSKKK